MTDASTRGILSALVLTALSGDHEAVNDGAVVEDLVALDPRLATVPGEARFDLAVKTRAQMEHQGIEDTLGHICSTIVEEDRSLAFSLCVRVMMADGKTDGEEAMVLGTLQELFGLSADAVKQYLDEERSRRAAAP